jgi:hypothetical protein
MNLGTQMIGMYFHELCIEVAPLVRDMTRCTEIKAFPRAERDCVTGRSGTVASAFSSSIFRPSG